MRIAYFGTGEISAGILDNFCRFEKPVVVITNPDSRKGRGMKLSPTPVKLKSWELGLKNILTPENLRDDEFLKVLREYRLDFVVVVDYGKVLPKEVLDIPKFYPLCFHPSLLPKYRGATPIERAFFNCDEMLGLTVFIINEKIDQGKIVMQDSMPISPCFETKGEVITRMVKAGADMLYRSIIMLYENKVVPRPQKGETSYAPKLRPEEEFINPEEGVKKTVGKINGLSPKPGARFIWKGKNLKILKARPYNSTNGETKVGEFVYLKKEKSLLLGCSDGFAEILLIQPPDKRPLKGFEFANGYL